MKIKHVVLIAFGITGIVGITLYSRNIMEARSALSASRAEALQRQDKMIDALNIRHKNAIKAIDQSWESIEAGNSYDAQGEYDQTAKAYEKAYALDRGSRAVSGLKLAMTYEKLGRYDDGIVLLDQMIQNGELSANGVKNANTIKDRLITAKSAN